MLKICYLADTKSSSDGFIGLLPQIGDAKPNVDERCQHPNQGGNENIGSDSESDRQAHNDSEIEDESEFSNPEDSDSSDYTEEIIVEAKEFWDQSQW